MGASICCAEAGADTQFIIFDLSALKKQCLIPKIMLPNVMIASDAGVGILNLLPKLK